MLIDGGPPDTWPLLKTRLDRLPEGDQRLDVVVITHIDSDHIGGLVPFFRSDVVRNNVGDVWFNGFSHLPDSDQLVRRSVGQAENVTDALFGDDQASFAWNSAFDRGPVATDGEGEFAKVRIDETAPTITLLSPTLKRLAILRARWLTALQRARNSEPEVDTANAAPTARLDDLDRLAGIATSKDTSAPNGSSIGFLIEHRGASCLLSGDGFGTVLGAALVGLAAARGVDAIEVDAFKLPHHGSQANVVRPLIDAAPARHYLVSTNGDTFAHPDDVAIARVIRGARLRPTLWFNYDNERTRRWDDVMLRQHYGYDVRYPLSATSGIVLELAERR